MPIALISKPDIVCTVIYARLMPLEIVSNLASLVDLNRTILTVKWLLPILFFLIRGEVSFEIYFYFQGYIFNYRTVCMELCGH